MGSFSDISVKISENSWVRSINQGLIMLIPMIILGAAGLVINNFPLPVYQQFMLQVFGSGWTSFGSLLWNFTFGIMGVALSFTIAYSYAIASSEKNGLRINPIIAALASLASFLLIITNGNTGIHTDNAGTTGVFLAIVVTFITTNIFIFLHKHLNIKYSSLSLDADYIIPQSLFSVIPLCLTITLAAGIHYLFLLFGIEDINQLFIMMAQQLFCSIDNPYLSFLMFVFLNQFLWFFGIHGGNVLFSVSNDIYMNAVYQNMLVLQSGGIPSIIITKPFLDVFVLIGGCGTTICLLLAIFITAPKSNLTKLAKISLIPALFNINEIIVFGLPIVLNPIFVVPFITVPLVLAAISCVATIVGLVPVTIAPVNWTTPPLLGGWIATGSWTGMALQVFNIAVGTLIYIPFVRYYEHQKNMSILKTYNELIDVVMNVNYSNYNHVLSRKDQIGGMANILVREIREALVKEDFFLVYQPQINDEGKVIGVEALLRWKHPRYGMVPAPLIVKIAEEEGLIDQLGEWVIKESCSQLSVWNSRGIHDLQVSINISPTQLREDILADYLNKVIQEYNVEAKDLELEIIENVAFDASEDTIRAFNHIKALGVSIAMDDFGAGHSSMYCMINMNLSRIKIDGSFVINLENNINCQNIIASIILMAKKMNTEVIAEYVETEEQLSILKDLGCKQFQGYLFSQPLLPADFEKFFRSSL